MRRTVAVISVIVGLLSSSGAELLRAQEPAAAQITINNNGAPAAGMQVVLNLVNKGKVPVGTVSPSGQLVLDLANMPKVRVEIAVEDCPDPNGGTHVLISQPGAKQEDRCRRRIIGFWLWGNGTVAIDTGAGTVQVIGGQSFFTTPTGLAVIG
ncbi:MAG: hypothetical protein EHM55_06675, partial [Acidobacteria bacterium]